MKSVRFVVAGRVQGVWFRAFTEREARTLGIAGWVRNLPDGRVEGHAEGDEGQVDALLARVRAGSPGSRVDAVEVSAASPEGHATFSIRR